LWYSLVGLDPAENKMQENTNDKIPLFKSWKGWYIFVLAILLFLILFFYFITKRFA
jgi:hypothetical protein